MFANLLIESFSLRRKKLIRVGGDEFLILLEVERKEIVDNYIQNLNKNIEAYNKTKEKPYELKFSYGVACCSNTKEDIHDILKCADKLMYEQKKSRKMKL